jgi:peroxin-1
MPDEEERLDVSSLPQQDESGCIAKPSPIQILQALTRKLELGSEFDLSRLAAKTAGFSGADLQSLISNAQLEAIHDVLDVPDTDPRSSTGASNLSPTQLRLWQDKERSMNVSQKSDLLKQVNRAASCVAQPRC